MNPLLPYHHFVPDAEARVWADGRIYLYGSYDLSGYDTYCSYEYHVFSSDDMRIWRHEGESFRSSGPGSGVPWAESPLYAPDCITKDGRYWLYFCLANGSEGVAVADSPAGPFTDASPVLGADGDGIDPAALVDDDGQVYYYWGQHHLRGARLKPDMRSIEPATLQTHLLTEEADGFHEGASIRKINGLYYLVYTDIARGRATCLSYATSPAPLGPFTRRGVIIDNTGCDPETWNNHGSIAPFQGRWYVFYHRSTQATRYNRRACAEPLTIATDGSIAEVEMTTQGAGGPLDPCAWLDASRACRLSGSVRVMQFGPDANRAIPYERLGRIQAGDWAEYKYYDFGPSGKTPGVTMFKARAGCGAYGGTIEIRLDAPDGPLAGTCEIRPTGGWEKCEVFACNLGAGSAPAPEGVRALYLVFQGKPGRLFDLEGFRFL